MLSAQPISRLMSSFPSTGSGNSPAIRGLSGFGLIAPWHPARLREVAGVAVGISCQLSGVGCRGQTSLPHRPARPRLDLLVPAWPACNCCPRSPPFRSPAQVRASVQALALAPTSTVPPPLRCNLSPSPAFPQHRCEPCLEKSVRCGGSQEQGTRESGTRDKEIRERTSDFFVGCGGLDRNVSASRASRLFGVKTGHSKSPH
jgi:hypothetical protein